MALLNRHSLVHRSDTRFREDLCQKDTLVVWNNILLSVRVERCRVSRASIVRVSAHATSIGTSQYKDPLLINSPFRCCI